MININGVDIGKGYKPYIVAEVSANHNGSIDKCKNLIRIAKEKGADAVKLQTYKPESLTVNSRLEDFLIKDGLWKGRNLYELYEEAHTPWEWFDELFSFASKNKITIFSSPFDKEAVDLLESLDCPAYKIASFEILDHELIRYAASKKKPIILSTGMADKEEIQEAIDVVKQTGNENIVILHCVSGYPSKPEDYNLRTVLEMQKSFGVDVGLSDHTISNNAAIASVALDICFIEKHFTLDKNGGGPDDSFSMEPQDLENLCLSVKEAYASLGKANFDLKEAEKNSLVFRRSLYFMKNLKKGHILSKDDVRCIRPGYGIKPKYINDIIGKKLKNDVSKHKAVSFKDFE
tara:strand:+ start:4640 stop:5680 length:1041 start_codon:yes stop_codon:yes gene_type:complete